MSEQVRFDIDDGGPVPPAGQAGQAPDDAYKSTMDDLEVVFDDETILELPSGAELPEDPVLAAAVLFEELSYARAAEKNAEIRWKRTAAEFKNYRRRARRDQADLITRSSERVASRMLPVIDSLDAALASEAVGSAEAGIREGLSGTRDLLLSVLAGEGLAPIEALGAAFDPALHEAAQIGEGEGAMVVEAELRRGYTLAGKVVRASLVVVGYQPAEAPAPPESSGEAGGEAEEEAEGAGAKAAGAGAEDAGSA